MRAKGNWLNNEEQKEVIKELNNSKEFKTQIKAMKEETFFDENSIIIPVITKYTIRKIFRRIFLLINI
ncbi:hypothetical protein J32TS6_15630 [Virgibacillus pantothenticus]|uniref:Uncharacterized protein n=1 Tax=Virgibacillus pantothenticus TaxID=1473 RepID=A0A0L0QJZ9_VIRPA|nr:MULTISPECIES: hypothetical protein [Virgibacillus]API92921.1 hypothetical protein BKP57_14550 [Virgibacillus sp. 6R]KNE18844.1 hypothetical protein AFK71_09635 [Virgibacillus pantothenticus]MBS7428438.1 hypothetical protein [Virgibacillus sp. 19R1-5]MBU8568284.1 hypothetical protein [Virgibacillus pantothenticus]MBU8602255.1 hypothetical protein [Virgibacillus pantothenticus]